MSLFDSLTKISKQRFDNMFSNNILSLEEYLNLCKSDPSVYSSPAERLLKAIGEPKIIDTSEDPRLGRIFLNRKIRIYPAFSDFYGMEETIENLVSFLKHYAQGLEESKQILYFLGPVGGGKSSLVDRIEELMETQPVYVLRAEDELSPVFDDPLSLFNNQEAKKFLENEYNIPSRVIITRPSPWVNEKLKEFGGDISKFTVEKIYPSKDHQICISKIEPGDPNNQDISALVGKIDIRKLEDYPSNHPYAYSYSGGLCRGNRGVVNFAEMFKADIKTLNPLLEATQSHSYNGTEAISGLPFQGIIFAHSNESEWQKFRNDKTNEAFLDRVFIIKVPYCLRVTEEVKIYEKLLHNSALEKAPCAPDTLQILARFSVLTRLVEPENSSIWSKMRVYDGENIKDTDPKAKPLQEYKDDAKEKVGVNEGMTGMSTRFAFKVLSKTFDMDPEETAANPVHLFYVLENSIEQEHLPKDIQNTYIDFIKSLLIPKYVEYLEKELRVAFLESYSDYGQNIFEKYVMYADAWISDTDFRHPETHEMYDRKALDDELNKIEKPAQISNPKDFRHEIVNFVLRHKANNKGEFPRWNSFEKIKTVIEQKMFSATEDIMPVISFGPKSSSEDQKKHDDFVKRMMTRGYTKRQIKLLVEWYQRIKKSTS
jgi:serine protein kinase